MKKIILFLIFPTLCAAQDSLYWNDATVHFGFGNSSVVYTDSTPADLAKGITVNTGIITAWGQKSFLSGYRVPDCEAWEEFTEWKAENTGIVQCAHDWVNAKWNEVNVIDLFATLEMPPPCGKTRHENEARICRACLRHETRVRTYGMKEVERKTEYQALLEKIKDR